MSSRSKRAQIAAETLAIVQGGVYLSPAGKTITIGEGVQMACENTVLYSPRDARSLRRRADAMLPDRQFQTTFEVVNETTLAAGQRLVARYGPDRVAALNFASAKNPGGGFLNGSQAQEESLARATALYSSLLRQPGYYDANRGEPSLLYTDHMIVSPEVPVVRDDEDQLLDAPWAVTILTSPAPNAGAIATNQPEALEEIESTFRRRLEQVLSAAVVHGQTALVLGAWGCGVFRNDPERVATWFAEQLRGEGAFNRAFEHVVFAVLDRNGETIRPFTERFG